MVRDKHNAHNTPHSGVAAAPETVQASQRVLVTSRSLRRRDAQKV